MIKKIVTAIVTAQIEDLREILELQKECYQSEANLYNDYNIPPLTQTVESIKEELNNGWLFLKIIHQQDIIATGRGVTKDGTTYIAKLAVKKELQNCKLGQKILREIENRLSNCTRYELFTGHRSERNLYLYKKFGYSEFKREYINDRLTLIYLEKHKTITTDTHNSLVNISSSL